MNNVSPIRKFNAEEKVLEFFKLKEEIERLTKAKADLLQDIARDHDFQPAEILGHKLKLAERKGNIDYQALLAKYLPKVNVEPFRKAGTVYWTLT